MRIGGLKRRSLIDAASQPMAETARSIPKAMVTLHRRIMSLYLLCIKALRADRMQLTSLHPSTQSCSKAPLILGMRHT